MLTTVSPARRVYVTEVVKEAFVVVCAKKGPVLLCTNTELELVLHYVLHRKPQPQEVEAVQLRAYQLASTNGKVSIHGTVDRHNVEYTVDEVADAVVDGEAEHTLSGAVRRRRDHQFFVANGDRTRAEVFASMRPWVAFFILANLAVGLLALIVLGVSACVAAAARCSAAQILPVSDALPPSPPAGTSARRSASSQRRSAPQCARVCSSSWSRWRCAGRRGCGPTSRSTTTARRRWLSGWWRGTSGRSRRCRA
jgi:hypothetical protein